LTNSIGNKPVIQITGFEQKKIVKYVPYSYRKCSGAWFSRSCRWVNTTRRVVYDVDDETKIKFRIYGGTNFKKGDLIF